MAVWNPWTHVSFVSVYVELFSLWSVCTHILNTCTCIFCFKMLSLHFQLWCRPFCSRKVCCCFGEEGQNRERTQSFVHRSVGCISTERLFISIFELIIMFLILRSTFAVRKALPIDYFVAKSVITIKCYWLVLD